MTPLHSSAADAASSTVVDRMPQGLAAIIPLLLRSIDETIASRLAPEVKSANGQVTVDMIHSLLGWAIRQMEVHGLAYAARMAVTEGQPFSGMRGLLTSPTEAERRYADAVSDMAIPREAGEIRALLAAETAFRTLLDPESADDPATAYQGGKSAHARVPVEERKVSEATLTAYLRARFPTDPTSDIIDFALLPGGFSKETILFQPVGGPYDGQELVLRKDHGEKGTDFSVVDEYPLLLRLHAAGMPVPEPLWVEADRGALGAAFIIMRRVPGTLVAQAGLDDERTVKGFTRKLAAQLAALHALPVDDADALDVTYHVRRQIEELRAFWVRRRLESSPAIETLLCWLEENVPLAPGVTASIVHGDYGFHNLIIDGDTVSAILDWEFAHVGDPAEDVAYCRQFLEPIGQWSAFLQFYREAGGKSYDDERDRFFAIWQNVRNAVYCCGALEAFVRGAPGNIRLASAGLSMAPRFELAALRQILTIAEQ